ncbi:MAG: right-handed parallel beta-helix repeat-containing protein [Planctomycetes bacterium]|nr:right-handed parallel beta-helix repeat-containing protein [Planctomycetota bacterium]
MTQNPAWLAVAATTRSIPPGGSIVVSASIDTQQAATLVPGDYTADASYRNSSTGQWTVLVHFVLTVQARSPTDGWTTFTPSADTRIVYVSSASGSDGNDGLSPSTPRRTIAAGKALLRNGRPDWLLLERGGTWDESLGQWMASGRSVSEPMLVSSYGSSTERPYLRTGSGDGVSALASGASPPRLDHVAIVGLRFHANTYVGNGQPSGVAWLIPSSDLLIEDCLVQGYQIDVSVPGYGGRKQNVRIRRNVIVDAFATTGTVGHGIYLANCDDVLIEENVLDHNGWSETVPGALPTTFRHGIYIQGGSGTCTNVTVRGNIVSNSAAYGLHLRPGGVADDNLFLRNSIALSLGGGNEPNPGGVAAIARGNVILDGKNIDSANPRGWAIELANMSSGTVSDNIIANQTLAGFPIAMNLYGTMNGLGVHDTQLARNIVYNWGGSISLQGNANQLSSIAFVDNDVCNLVSPSPLVDHANNASTASLQSMGNAFYSSNAVGHWMRHGGADDSLAGWKSLVGDTTSVVLQPAAYPDPGRTVARYNQSLGGLATHAAFMAEARRQSKSFWRPEYTAQAVNAYVRAGFGVIMP